MKDNKKDDNQLRLLIIICIAIAVVFGLVIPIGFLLDGSILLGRWEKFNGEKAAQLGSYWSGIGSFLFSGAALYLLYQTYSKQSEELRYTRKIAEDQAKTLDLQRFEQTFFSILDLLKKEISSIESSKIPLIWFTQKRLESELQTDEMAALFVKDMERFKNSDLERIILIIDKLIDLMIRNEVFENEPFYRGITIASLPEKVKYGFVCWTAINCCYEDLVERSNYVYKSGIISDETVSQLPKRFKDALISGSLVDTKVLPEPPPPPARHTFGQRRPPSRFAY